MLVLLRRLQSRASSRLACASSTWRLPWAQLSSKSATPRLAPIRPDSLQARRRFQTFPGRTFYRGNMAGCSEPLTDNMDDHAREIFLTAVNSVLPIEMIKREVNFSQEESLLKIRNKEYHLSGNVQVVGFGKAVCGMARAVEDILGGHIAQGVISIPLGTQASLRAAGKHELLLKPDSRIEVFEGAKDNLPDCKAHQAAQRIQAIASKLKKDDILLVLISGGGSALLPLPYPPVRLEEEMALTSLMSRKGASILDLNTVRKHLEVLKGGGLARAAQHGEIVSLIMSDVIGDPLEMIASGPTVRDTSTVHHCLQIFSRLGIASEVPQSIMDLFNSKKQRELVRTSSIDEPSPHYYTSSDSFQWNRVQNVVIGSNALATQAASRCASEMGYIPLVVSTTLSGEARDVGAMFARLAQFVLTLTDHKIRASHGKLARLELSLLADGLEKSHLNEVQAAANMAINKGQGLCIIAGGETVVTVRGTGKGGRNQEMALAAMLALNQFLEDWGLETRHKVLFCSAGTDGQDGPTDAAGAMVTGDLVAKAEGEQLDLQAYLDNNDSYSLFSSLQGGRHLLKPGLTSTNVMDIQVLLIQFS